MGSLVIALAGNPNTGKSTLFNALTGEHQHVGNWTGKTVEKKDGYFVHQGHTFTIVDLPGTYSLSAYSPEEQIARDFMLSGTAYGVVNVVDASNLERNLYLTVQILETGIPVIVVLSMNDLARARGFTIDYAQLSQRLGGIPVIPLVASRGQGLAELKQALLRWLIVHPAAAMAIQEARP